MNINLKYIFYIIAIILIFFCGYQCGGDNIDIPKVTKTTSDTTITHSRTIIPPKDTVIPFKDKPVPYPVYIDTFKYKPLPIDTLELYRFFQYNDSIEDENIKIYSSITTQGKTLKEFKPSYKLKVPLIIIDSIKTIIRDSIFLTKVPKYQLGIGIQATPKSLAPTVDLSINRSTYSIGYDPFNELPVIKYSFRIWKSKK